MSDTQSLGTERERRSEVEDFWREQLQEAANPGEQAAFRSRQQLRGEYFATEVQVNLIAAIELSLNAQAGLPVAQESVLPRHTREELLAGINNLSIEAAQGYIATSNPVLSVINTSLSAISGSDPELPWNAEAIAKIGDIFRALKTSLQSAGRNESGGTPELDAPVVPLTRPATA